MIALFTPPARLADRQNAQLFHPAGVFRGWLSEPWPAPPDLRCVCDRDTTKPRPI